MTDRMEEAANQNREVEEEPWKWKKVLYGGVQAGYEDNYTDESFLEDMVMNANVRKRNTWTVMRDSVAVSHHGGIFSSEFFQRHVLNFSLFVTALYILSPIFQTLTRSSSSDSIYASTVCLNLLHLLFHDYTFTTPEQEGVRMRCLLRLGRPKHQIFGGYGDPPTPRAGNHPQSLLGRDLFGLSPGTPPLTSRGGSQTGSPFQEGLQPRKRRRRKVQEITFSANVSLNASIIAFVLIAARPNNSLIVFALMLFSLEFFLLFPLVVHGMRRKSVNFHLGFSCALILVTMVVVFPVSRLAFYLFVVVIFFITAVGPYWLIKIQE